MAMSKSDGEGKKMRQRVLSDPKTRAQILKVLRARGVPESELEDLVQEVLLQAFRAPGFPEHSDDEGRRYAVGIARYEAIDHANDRKEQPEVQSLEGLPETTAAPDGLPYEDRDLVHKAVGLAHAKSPRKVEAYVRSEIHGDTHVEMAREQNVSPGRMRSYSSDGKSTLRAAMRALGGIAAVLAVVSAIALWLRRHEGEVTHSPREYAAELREKARRDCAASEWKTCADELRRANEAWPEGETPELKALREKAEERARSGGK
jgi:RNA polymerase sigma-70 factor (ECF subfamily)